jgi:thiol-disulfide isomerase/thioredoxin
MKTIKYIIVGIALLTNFGLKAQQDSAATKDGLVWYTDVMVAKDSSNATNKPIFAFFTGSDWCGWCMKLQRNVFAKAAFIEWAKENVILLELDFPRFKQLPPQLAEQNAGLQQAFQVRGYPTVWLFTLSQDSVANKFVISALGSSGYPSGATQGKEEVKFLTDLNAILEKRVIK